MVSRTVILYTLKSWYRVRVIVGKTWILRKRTEAYIRHWLMRYYLDLVKIIARYEVIIAWYEIIMMWYAIIITLYVILKRNNEIFITRNALINF